MVPADSFCFLNVRKPKGITSFDVIYKLRKITGIKKIGHSGTLDPLASGVMQVAVGRATKLIDYLPSDKKYCATLKFGFISSTYDCEGEIKEVEYPKFSENELINALNSFMGEIYQKPPIYSAIKINGKKLCDTARKLPTDKHEFIDIPKRKINIYDIELLEFDSINYTAKINVFCSKGTYIRSLADDIGKKLNTGAYITDLIRTKAGSFLLNDSVEIEDINLDKHAINPLNALDLPVYELSDNEYEKVKNGIHISSLLPLDEGNYILKYKNSLVSVAILSDNIFKYLKVFKLAE